MLSWLLRQINASSDFADHFDEVEVQFHHPVVLAALVLLVPLAVFIYLRQLHNLPSVPAGIRFTLTATRILILAIFIVILAGPFLKLHLQSEKKPVVAFLLDHSQSMQLPAGPFESDSELTPIALAAGYKNISGQVDSEARKALNRVSRAKLAQSVLQNQTQLLGTLSKKYDLQYYSFSRDLTQMSVNASKPEFPEPPSPGGNATQMGDAVARLLEESASRQIAGIVLFSDGQNTGGRSPNEAALAAKAVNTPIFTVPVGTATRLRDVAIVDVFTTGLVSLGDTARVSVTVESQGFDKRPVKVILKDGDKQLDVKDLILNSAEQQQIELTFKTEQPGPRYLTVHIPPLAEEPDYLRANNTDTAFLRVSEEKIKVLLIDGLPRWDFRFLKNAMRRDNGLGGVMSKEGKEIDVRVETEWRRLPALEQKAALPRTLEKLSEYHTIILGDVSPAMLDTAFIDMLVKAVREKGVGLIVAAGTQAMPHRYDDRLLDLLPVRLRKGVNGMLPSGVPSFRLDLAPEGVIHEATRFYDDPGRNQNAWTQLPRYYWAAATEKPAAGATVLVWNPLPGKDGKLPLIAHHYAGKGKVMFVGTDSTWLWRQNVGDRFFYKFWGQGVRSVARTDARDAKKSRVEVRPVRAQPGEQAEIELRAVNAEGSPLTAATATVQIQGGGTANTVELTSDPMVKGRYLGRFTPATAAEYRISYTAPGQADLVEARLRVSATSEEMRQPNVNRPALEQLATSSGGQLVELPGLDSIAEQLKGEPSFRELHREADLWDNWMTLTLLVVLYSLDVGLRRLLGLS
jgi:hypothetical protein